MDDIHDLKGKARALESSGQDAAALQAYLRALAADEPASDAGLRAKIGSLQLRLGNVEEAVESLARAADLYTAAGFRNNALALCNRILEADPDRAEFYLRLGELSAEQGYLGDARRRFSEYENRMTAAGDAEAAARGQRAYARYFPDASTKSSPREPERDLPVLPLDTRPATPSKPSAPDRGPRVEDFGLVGNRPDGDWAADSGESLPPLEAASLIDAPAAEPRFDRIEGLEGLETSYSGAGGGDSTAGEPVDSLPLLGSEPVMPTTASTAEDGDSDSDPLPLLDTSPLDVADATGALPEEDPLSGSLLDQEVVEDEVLQDESLDQDLVRAGAAQDEVVEDERGEDAPPEVLAGLRERVALAPRDARAHERLVEHLAEFGTIPELEEALADAHVATAAAGEFSAAADFAARLAGVRPDDAAVLQTWAEYAFRSGDRHRLVAAYLAVARRFSAAGQADSARHIFERIVKLEPDNEEARRGIGAPPPRTPDTGDYVDFGAMVLDDEEDSTRFQVEADFPTGDEAHDFGEILTAFRQQITEKLDASDSASHYDLGLAFKEMGLWDDAITQLQRAMRAGSNPLGTLEVLGECYVEKGEHDKAARMLDRAVQLPGTQEADLIGVYYWLGRSREGLGDASAARESYQHVTSTDPRFRDAAERLEALREF